MPMPVPQPSESQSAFVSRCTGFMIGEGKPQAQAVAICYTQWKNHKKKSIVENIKKLTEELNELE